MCPLNHVDQVMSEVVGVGAAVGAGKVAGESQGQVTEEVAGKVTGVGEIADVGEVAGKGKGVGEAEGNRKGQVAVEGKVAGEGQVAGERADVRVVTSAGEFPSEPAAEVTDALYREVNLLRGSHPAPPARSGRNWRRPGVAAWARASAARTVAMLLESSL
jgi:hypothetical protein